MEREGADLQWMADANKKAFSWFSWFLGKNKKSYIAKKADFAKFPSHRCL